MKLRGMRSACVAVPLGWTVYWICRLLVVRTRPGRSGARRTFIRRRSSPRRAGVAEPLRSGALDRADRFPRASIQ